MKLSRAASFWLLATVFAFFLFAAGVPSPLYVVYEAMWHFSSLTLTAIFGVYALALLAALLTTGRLCKRRKADARVAPEENEVTAFLT